MSGDRFEDTSLGPQYKALLTLVGPVVRILIDAGMDPYVAANVGWRAMYAVLEGVQAVELPVSELLAWRGIGDG